MASRKVSAYDVFLLEKLPRVLKYKHIRNKRDKHLRARREVRTQWRRSSGTDKKSYFELAELINQAKEKNQQPQEQSPEEKPGYWQAVLVHGKSMVDQVVRALSDKVVQSIVALIAVYGTYVLGTVMSTLSR